MPKRVRAAGVEAELETPAGEEPAALRGEVAALLGQLGLAAGAGAGSGFDDRDFRPQKAGKKKAAPAPSAAEAPEAAPRAKSAPRREREPARGPAGSGKGTAAAAEPPEGQPPAPDATQAQPRKGRREWREGAGPPPAVQEEDWAASSGTWYEQAAALPPPPAGACLDPSAVRVAAQSALALAAGRGKPESAAWLRLVRTAGTSADKVAAAVLQAQAGAGTASGLRALDTLLALCDGSRGAGGKRGAGQALEALRELFASHLLPPARKLHSLDASAPAAAAAGGTSALAKAHLAAAAYEDGLKERYGRFVMALAELSKDPLEWLKQKAVTSAATLLAAAPEGEAALLALLVNKLGDPGRRAASGASHALSTLLAEHPAMKGVVAREVGRFMARPRVGLRARYAAACFLAQLPLSHAPADAELAERLVLLYVNIFQQLLAAETEAHLAGDGAFKSGPAGAAVKKKRPANKKKKVDKSGKPSADAVADASAGVDSRLLRALLTGINRALPYVPPAAADALGTRVAPPLFRVAHAASLGVACQALTLLHHTLARADAASDRFCRALYALLLHPGLPRAAAAPQLLALAFRALRSDVNPKRVAAVVKRLLQVATIAPPPFACGALLLVSEVLREQPALWVGVTQAEEGDGVETFGDAALPVEEEDNDATAPTRGRRQLNASFDFAGSASAATPTSDDDGDAPSDAFGAPTSRTLLSCGYDPAKREPAFAGAERAGLWELTLLANHGHSSVAAMARSLLAQQHVVFAGDPLRDLSLAAFLDRWLQKKPKPPPARPGAIGFRKQPGERGAAPGTAEFAALEEADVAPEDVFFHRYFAARSAKAAAAAARRRPATAASDEEEEEEEEVAGAADARAARLRRADTGGDEFGSDSDPDEAAALAAAEADEIGDAGAPYDDLAEALWADSDGEEDGGASSSEEEDEKVSAFADADEYEAALEAGGVEGSGEEGEEEEDDDGELLLSGSEEEAPKAAAAKMPKSRRGGLAAPKAGAGTRRGKRSATSSRMASRPWVQARAGRAAEALPPVKKAKW